VNKFKALAAAPLVAASALTLLMTGSANAAGAATLTGSPTTGLTNGQIVTVSGTGFAPSTTIYIVECSSPAPAQSNCDITHLAQATSSASGAITATAVTARTGPIGDGTCAAGGTNCSITASSSTPGDPKATLAITFAAAAAASPSAAAPTTTAAAASPTAAAKTTGAAKTTAATKTSAAATSAATTTAAVAPTAVAAGTGGHAGDNGLPMGITILAIAGVAVVGAGTVRLARR
jgi:hypothetical protein